MRTKCDTNFIVEQYTKMNRSAASIAKEIGCCEKTISCRLRKAGVPTKRRVKQDLKQNLCGRVFGRLTVLSQADQNKSGDFCWVCVCKCGNMKIQTARSLLRKDAPVKSCGCARRKNHRWDKVPPFILSTIKNKASGRGIMFEVDLEYCDELFKKQSGKCALSGIPIKFGRRRDVSATTASLDRINSSLPYREGNLQWVHKKINIMKNSLSDQEFILFCRAVSEFNGGEK